MTSPVIVTGVPTIPGSDGSVPIRHEVRDLQKNYPQQWDLFCLGLLALQNVDENDELSFYQIAGIHGLPYTAWNGVNGIDGQQTGYCTHSSILFLPWHRPYLCLFEQTLWNTIQGIANSYTESLRSQYVAAANIFRLPYWDWGLEPQAGQTAFPASLSGPVQIQVTGVDGTQQTIRNPLLQYNFNVDNLNRDFPDAPYNAWGTTLRYPRDSTPNAASQEPFVDNAFLSQIGTIRRQIMYCFTSITDFGPFSNDKWIQNNPGSYPSLEDIHDNIHVLVGGPGPSNQSAPAGHMSNIPYAAFDPVFWMHHCNVDRMFAMFQAIYPNSYVVDEPTADGTFTEPPGYTETVTSDLTPFWKDGSTFHSPRTAQSTISLGYAYQETQSWNYTTTATYQASVKATINMLYDTKPPGAISFRHQESLPAAIGIRQGKASTNSNPVIQRTPNGETKMKESSEGTATAVTGEIDSNKIKNREDTSILSKINGKIKTATIQIGSLINHGNGPALPRADDDSNDVKTAPKQIVWIINIHVKKHSLGGPFSIHCFLGDVPPDTNMWLSHVNNIGTCSILGSNPTTTTCEKCRTDASRGLIVTGVVPLTERLCDTILEGNLPSLDPVDVVPYLAKALHWRVTQIDGTERRCEEVEDLQISIISTEKTESDNPDEFPVYSGNYHIHVACTQGKPGGYNHGDQY